MNPRIPPYLPPHSPPSPALPLGHESASQPHPAGHQYYQYHVPYYNPYWDSAQQREFLRNVHLTAGGGSSTAGAAPPASNVGFRCHWLTGYTPCGQVFASFDELMDHMGDLHDVQGASDRRMDCQWQTNRYCGRNCRRDAFRRHIAVHVGISVPCTDCGKSFSRSDSLRAHAKKQHGKQ